MRLAVVETHPVQYHAPVYRAVQQTYGVPVTAIYGSDFSVAGYRDPEFGTRFAWDTDLLSGYSVEFLSRTAAGGADSALRVSSKGLRRILRRLRPSAVLIVGYSPGFHRAAWLTALGLRCRVLFRGETNDAARSRTWVKSRARDHALRLAYRTCARLLYIGRRSREHFERLGVGDDRLVFSPYCVDVSPFETGDDARSRLRDETRRQLGIRSDRRLILFSGKLTHRKGVDLILAAMKTLDGSLRDRLVACFLGDGAMRDEIDRFAAADPRVEVRLPGFRNQRELSRHYHAADLLVLPSRTDETWGLVVNEALHHGVPCVVSDRVGCAPDLVEPGRTGEVAAAGSVEALAAALSRAFAWNQAPGVREACRGRVAAFSVDRAAEGVARAFETAVAGGTRCG